MKTRAYLQELKDRHNNTIMVTECGSDTLNEHDWRRIEYCRDEIKKINECLQEIENACYPLESY
jgi:beta-glucosidase/6-phospho-beta-glucosidase/beta-galactosidase